MSVPAGQRTVREHNRGLVLRSIAAAPGSSRAQMAAETGLTRATVSALVEELVGRGLVVEGDPERTLRGRPASPLHLNPNGPMGLGIEVNVDYLAACIVDLTGAVRAHRSEPSDNRSVSPSAVIRRAVQLAERVRREADSPRIAGVGVGLPGLVLQGEVRFAPNLASFSGLPIGEQLSVALEAPVLLDNEANLAALAELWYGNSSARDFVQISGEIGVGMGVVIGGQLFRGVHGFAGEFGHVVVDPDGPPCRCGSRGCLEQLAGQEALLRNANVVGDAGSAIAAPEAIAELLRRLDARDPIALQALESAGHALGLAVAGVVNVLDVPRVVLGGLYSRLGPWLLPTIRADLARGVVSSRWAQVELMTSALGPDAAVRGAAGVIVSRLIATAGDTVSP